MPRQIYGTIIVCTLLLLAGCGGLSPGDVQPDQDPQAPDSADVDENVTENASQPVDTDGDGLTDQQETSKYGTDPETADTDGDGLNDSAEVNIYETDPLSAILIPMGCLMVKR